MKYKDWTEISTDKYTKTITPLKGRKKVKNPLIFGFDVEWKTQTEEVISYQLSHLKDGELHSKVYETSNIMPGNLIESANEFLVGSNPTFYFISHFACGDLGHIENVLEDFKLRTVHKAVHAYLEHKRQRVGRVRLRIIDLFAFIPQSLQKIGEWLGLKKIDLMGKLPHEALEQDEELFYEYAKRDAEICLLAFQKLREDFWDNYKVDILRRCTVQDATQAAFRRGLRDFVNPVRTEKVVRSVRRKSGWKKKIEEKILYDGLMKIREFAARCYWGGRNEAYYRGIADGDWKLYDVISLYPSSIMLTPLPLARTEWTRDEKDLQNKVGFVKLKFHFPPNVDYPNLPVMKNLQTKLYFPLKGESHCTTFELDKALEMGCNVGIEESWTFEPGESEIEHPLKEFVSGLLKRKKESRKGTLNYELPKLMANSIYGKLCQKNPQLDECSFLEIHKRQGLTIEEVKELYSNLKYRQQFKKKRSVGPLWNPLWASLITGKARAIMSDFVNKGAKICMTDGFVIEGGANLECKSLEELKSVGSGLKLEAEGDRLWIGKDRCYALQKSDKITACAGHGTHMRKTEFSNFIAKCIKKGELVENTWVKKRIGSLKDELIGKRKMGCEIKQEVQLRFPWDGKRNLTCNPINIFKEGSNTKPLESAVSPQLDKGKNKSSDRRQEEISRKVKEVSELNEKYATPITKACKKIGIPRSTYYNHK